MVKNVTVKVTLDIFSGIPNIEWKLSEEKAKEFFHLPALKSMIVPEKVENRLGLGYRGFIITILSSDDTEDAGLPDTFRIMGPSKQDRGVPEPFESAVEPKSMRDDEIWLLESSEKLLSSQLKEHAKNTIQSNRQSPKNTSSPQLESVESISTENCIMKYPHYNPLFWNSPFVVEHNNCYNYASNYRSNTFAQPGRISRLWDFMPQMTCNEVTHGALSDGLKKTCRGLFSTWEVALILWPPSTGIPGDYHWYRRDMMGYWSHKPGQTPARNWDDAGNPITDPMTCDRGEYTIFCGYYFCQTGTKVE